MRKIMNNPKLIVSEMLKGLSYVDEKLEYFSEEEVIARKKVGQCKVGVVSGGGAGHEPAHAGYVGEGMLDAAVAGNVFASPDPIRVLKGIKEADTGKGVLLIIKNYSGDIMNFSMAKELAEMEGIKVEIVVVKDDVAVEDSEHSDGRRGIAGTVFVHKIAGAMAERGASLEEVKRVAQDQFGMFRYGKWNEAAKVPVGLSGPAALYDFIYGDQITDEKEYMEKVYPTRRELEYTYVQKAGIFYDLKMIVYTVVCILYAVCGKECTWMLNEFVEDAKMTMDK